MRDLEVIGVRIELPSTQPVVLLREAVGERVLPIWIGTFEAMAIAAAQDGIVPPRPMTHDLFTDVLEAVGRRVIALDLVGVRDGVFYAELVLDGGTRVSARPSDGIALAVRTGAPIRCSDDVLDEAGVLAPHEEDAEIEEFREFLDQVSPEDFGTG